MNRLLLIRHSETQHNADGRMVSASDPPLSEVGKAQSAALAESLSIVSIGRIVTSPMLRCRATAEALASGQRHEVTITVDERLRELELGAIEGLSPDEMTSNGMREVFDAWRQGRPPRYPDGAERFEDAAVRLRAVYDAAASSTDECAAIVGHSHALRIMLAVAVLDADPEAHRRLKLDHGVASEVRWELGVPRLTALNVRSLSPT